MEEMAISIFQANIIKNLKEDAQIKGIKIQNSQLYQKLSLDIISDIEIELEEFIQIFKGDEHQQKVLVALNREVAKFEQIDKIKSE